MLYIVLLLVLAALGLLVPALTGDRTFWAWLSVGASGAAAVVMVLDWWLRHRSGAPTPAVGTGTGTGSGDEQVTAGDQQAGMEGADVPGSPGQADVEPDEEDTDAADSLIVSDLADEVRVLDERPRYHLVACTWLASRPSLVLPVNEARQLGFTPCAVCRPDADLAARKRAAKQADDSEQPKQS